MYIHKILNYIAILLSLCIMVFLSTLTLINIWSNDSIGTFLLTIPTILCIVTHKLLYHQ